MKIRQTNNIKEIVEIMERCVPGDLLELNENIFWIVKDGGESIGFASLKPLPEENSIFLSLVGILPNARGAGIQRKLIKTRLNWAKRNGYKCAVTYTLMDNYPSISNLIKCGFKFYTPYYEWVGSKVFYFKKDI